MANKRICKIEYVSESNPDIIKKDSLVVPEGSELKEEDFRLLYGQRIISVGFEDVDDNDNDDDRNDDHGYCRDGRKHNREPWWKLLYGKLSSLGDNIKKSYAEKKINEVTTSLKELFGHLFDVQHKSIYLYEALLVRIVDDVRYNPEVYADALGDIMKSAKRISNELSIVSKEVKTTLKENKEHFQKLGSDLEKTIVDYEKEVEEISELAKPSLESIVNLFKS
jgi:gas vesicle protein